MIKIKGGPHEAEYRALVKAFIPDGDIEIVVEPDDGINTKNEEKLKLYKSLCNELGFSLPWGDLTGVRPVRIPLGKLYEGLNDVEIDSFLNDVYAVRKDKRELSLKIAHTEKKTIDSLGQFGEGIIKNHYCLYIGIPFCPSTCAYCSFTSFPLGRYKDIIDKYLCCLYDELRLLSEVYADYILDAVYIGGGTPSTLDAKSLSNLVMFIRNTFNVPDSLEFCVECGRPDSIDKEKLVALKDGLVNRICINPQTLSDVTLRKMGRAHNTKQFFEAFDLARSVDFDNINTDIILGLPGENIDDIKNTVNGLCSLLPESITVHTLSIKRAAKLNTDDKVWEAFYADMNECMDFCINTLDKNGLYPYYLYRQKNMAGNLENTGFAQSGYECAYNILMIEELCDIAAVGTGTVSKVTLGDGHIERIDAVKDVNMYFERFDSMMDKKRRFYKKWR